MKNKFEALKAFQSWPRHWQQLCAEYWAENDKPKVEVVAQQFQSKQPLSVRSFHGEWTVAQQEYLVFCSENCKTKAEAARMFLKKYPGRKLGAVKIQAHSMQQRGNGIMKVKY